MKKLFIYVIFTLGVLLLIPEFSCNAQIKYRTNGQLTIGDIEPYSWFPTTILGPVYIRRYRGQFLQIDVTPAATRLASHDDQIVFYNSATSIFNDIQVKNVYNYSDARAKTNIQPLKHGMDIVLKLKPVTFDFKDKSVKNSNAKNIGLLAQEVESILPNIVLTDEEGKKLINYTALIPILIDAIKSLQKQIDELKKHK